MTKLPGAFSLQTGCQIFRSREQGARPNGARTEDKAKKKAQIDADMGIAEGRHVGKIIALNQHACNYQRTGVNIGGSRKGVIGIWRAASKLYMPIPGMQSMSWAGDPGQVSCNSGKRSIRKMELAWPHSQKMLPGRNADFDASRLQHP